MPIPRNLLARHGDERDRDTFEVKPTISGTEELLKKKREGRRREREGLVGRIPEVKERRNCDRTLESVSRSS